MSPILPIYLLLLGLMSTPAAASDFQLANTRAVNNFIAEMVKEHQFDADRLREVFRKVKLHKSILDAISRPAESKPWYEYRPIFLTSDRIKGGVKFWQQHAELLQRARQTYGVPEEIIVAIIGVETRYGKHKGRFPVIDALSTLAFAYPPRSRFFRKELKEYLLMTREEGLDPVAQLGSYAGAMGMPQFIPSSFRQYAVDFDKDGRRDLWQNNADAIGSVGNYFKRHHWRAGEPVAHPVRVHGQRYKQLLGGGLEPRYSQQALLDNGVLLPPGLAPELKGMLIELQGRDEPEYWVGWHNFYVISRYNHSALYSMAVYQLSQEIRQRHTRLVANEDD
jgi:membrane-bound lytic murein transglycosylase B